MEVGGRAGLAEEPAEERAAGSEGRVVGGVTGDPCVQFGGKGPVHRGGWWACVLSSK